MFKRWWILLDPDNNGGGGGSSDSDPANLARNEAIEWRKKYDTLKVDFDKLQGEYNTLDKNHTKTTKELEETQGKLGEFTAEKARRAKITELLGHKDFKGKVEVDMDKAMKYLGRGAFDETKLETEVREAIEFVGQAVKAPSSSLAPAGAGDDKTDRPKVSSDPLGDLVRNG